VLLQGVKHHRGHSILAFFARNVRMVDCHIKTPEGVNKIASTNAQLEIGPLILMVTSPLGPVLRPARRFAGSGTDEKRLLRIVVSQMVGVRQDDNSLGVLAWLMAARIPAAGQVSSISRN